MSFCSPSHELHVASDKNVSSLLTLIESLDTSIIKTMNRKSVIDNERKCISSSVVSLLGKLDRCEAARRDYDLIKSLESESISLARSLDTLFLRLAKAQEKLDEIGMARRNSMNRHDFLDRKRHSIHRHKVSARSISVLEKERDLNHGRINRMKDEEAKIHLRSASIESTLVPVRDKIQSLSAMADEVQVVLTGVTAYGLTGYLGRCTASQKAILDQIAREIAEDAARSAGRKPRKKRTAAQKERHMLERRAARRGVPVEALLPGDLVIPTLTPARRHHDQRVTSRGGGDGYARRLATSRALGHAAAIADADHRRACPPEAAVTLPPSLPAALGDGARLIGFCDPCGSLAARGLGPEDLFSAGLLEHWLGEPASARIAAKGPKSRLTAPLIHIVAAWTPELADRARSGDLDLPFYHAFRSLTARLDLLGHRAVAVLHLDSASGHPHLHILISRVREDDHSLFSVDGSQRALALWLNARSNTALTHGNEALPADIDALAAPGKAAMAAEHLMAADGLTIIRSPVAGGKIQVPIQGPEAAKRIASVGSCSEPLAGGIWLFGVGADPKAKASWEAAMRAARRDGDVGRVAELLAAKPRNRGYCGEGALTHDGAAGEVGEGRLGGYLGRLG